MVVFLSGNDQSQKVRQTWQQLLKGLFQDKHTRSNQHLKL